MAEPNHYLLKVTGGPSYDTSTHETINVNTPKPLKIASEHIDASINVRIQNYRGLPKSSPTTSPYFTHPTHLHDLYALTFSFALKSPISGANLLFGNDFDHPIRDRLPPGFGTAFRIVKWMIDPGLEGDVYADEPHLYGPLLSSINVLRVGGKGEGVEGVGGSEGEGHEHEGEKVEVVVEGADGNGEESRKSSGMPGERGARKKYFLNQAHREGFQFEEGRTYWCDFFNPYLDFNEFSLKLPGFTLPIIRYWDGQPLRYVLKNKETNTPLFVLVFTLIPADKVDENGNEIKEKPAEESKPAPAASKDDDDDVD